MPLLQNDPITQLAFSVYENQGVYAVLIGSGMSRAAEIPTGWEITLDLVRRVALARGEAEQSDWAQWYRDQTGEEPNYSKLLEELGSSQGERRAILHGYIEPTEADREHGRKTPTNAHRAIARLVAAGYIKVIITTNFDRLMENALRDEGIEPTVVASEDALAGAEPLTHSRCYMLKLHGDYKDARILNTDEELSTYPAAYNTLLDRIVDEHGLIICGWSGEWDHALRAAILRAPNRRYPMFWAARGKPGSGAEELIAHRKARVVQIDSADEFFTSVQRRVEVLASSRQQNPGNVDLLVSTAKKYCSKPDYRIDLEDLFQREIDRLLAGLNDEQLSDAGQYSQAELRKRIALYEALTEPLARMAGVLGRWGDEQAFQLFCRLLEAVWRHANSNRGGLVVWLNLRSYPAVLIFTAYGLGLTRSENWSRLFHLFDHVLPRDEYDARRVVEALFAQAWRGQEGNVFKDLEGLADRRMPLSDHLYSVMEQWKTSFIGIDPYFDVTFDLFETLAAFAYCEKYTEGEMQQYVQSDAHGKKIPMPVGRFAWNTSTFRTIKAKLEDGATRSALLESGFAKRSDNAFQLLFAQVESRINSWW